MAAAVSEIVEKGEKFIDFCLVNLRLEAAAVKSRSLCVLQRNQLTVR
jgi:hypothetical protein